MITARLDPNQHLNQEPPRGAAVRLSILLALALLVTLIYWPSPAVYYAEWQDFSNITFTHGWLILAVCVALVVRTRRELAAAAAPPSRLALLGLAACILTWLVCYRASIQDLHITIFPAIFWLAVAAAMGMRVALLLAFPVAYFYFAVPSLAQLGPPLQALTVLAMRGFFWLTGPAVVISGDLIHIPNGSFRIEEGCSGLHFMIVGLAVAALHGELRRDSLRIRSIQIALMAMLALLANWIRVYTVIEAGYLTDMHSYLVTVSHYWFGWGVFAAALVIYFWIAAYLGDESEGSAAATPRTIVNSPVRSSALIATLAVLVLLPVSSWGLRSLQRAPPDLTAPAGANLASWSSVPSDVNSSWQPAFPGADQQQRLTYKSAAGDRVEIFRVAYRVQRQGAKLVGMNTTLTGKQLKLRSQDLVDTAVGPFRETLVTDRSGARWLIWSRLHTAGRNFVAPLRAQLWYGLHAIVAMPDASLTAFRVACGPQDCLDARRILREFAVGGVVQ